MQRLRRFQDRMQNRTLEPATVEDPDGDSEAVRVENAAVRAWHDQRLTLAWLDGTLQRVGTTVWGLGAGGLGGWGLWGGSKGGWC